MSKIRKVCVIGGGSAGWISAAMLAKSFQNTGRDITVTVIESPNIPIIGVGEGTFPTIVNTLHEIGLSEKDFLAECNASFKQGAEFRNWLHDPKEQEHSYYHPFDPPAMPKGIDLSAHWVRNKQDGHVDKNFASTVTVQAHLCDKNLAPKGIDTPEYNWMARYAYHLDAGKLGQMIKKHALKNLGVKHIYADLVSANLDDDGYIENVVGDDGSVYTADFYMDCTGFAGFLFDKTLKVPFVDKSQYLNVDSAVILQIPYADNETTIATHTISTAQEAGWIWDIALQNRRGTGYVYSSKHTTPERAENILKSYAGQADSSEKLRHISFPVGYREKFWVKNCVANGFSSGFVEPLEATAIAMTEAGVRGLASRFPETRAAMEPLAKHYNEVFKLRWDNIIDFVKLHYCLTKRTDTEFWKLQTNPKTIPPSLQTKLKAWKHYATCDADFPNKYEIFGVASWQYILYGLEYIPKYVECANIPKNILDKAFRSVELMGRDAETKLMTNKAFVKKYAH